MSERKNNSFRSDPLLNADNLQLVLAHCRTDKERQLAKLRASELRQKDIARTIGMSVGWVCETLASLRDRSGLA